MGVTVMIVMGLLSVLAISSFDFDALDELRARAEEAQAEQDEEEFVDTGDLGWLDVPTDDAPEGEEIPNLELLQDNLLNFATAPDAGGAVTAPEDDVAEDVLAGVDADTMDPFDSFDQVSEQDEANIAIGKANDLWPLDAQSEQEELAQTGDTDEPEDAEDMVELFNFDATEDALELAYIPKLDGSGVELPPEVSVTHHEEWTEVGVDDDAHAFAHTASSDFKGLVAEDVLLRRVA